MRFTTLTPLPRPAFREPGQRLSASHPYRRVGALEAATSEHEQAQDEKDSSEFGEGASTHKHIDTLA